MTTRRELLGAMVAGAGLAQAQGAVTKYVRFRKGTLTAHGILEGETIRELRGDLFGSLRETGTRHNLSEVMLLYPGEPTKMLALAGNY